MRSRSIRPSCLFAAAVAALAALVIGMVIPLRPARSMQLLIPPGGTIQGNPSCGTSPNTNDILSFGGSTWCGTSTPQSTRMTIAPAALSSDITTDGDLEVKRSLHIGLLDFGSGSNWIDFGALAGNQWTVEGGSQINTPPIAVNGDAVMSAAPRMSLAYAATEPANPAIATLAVYKLPAAITVDNCAVTWLGWAACTTTPVYQLWDTTAGVAICQANVTTTATVGVPGAPLTASVPANDVMVMRQIGATAGCTQAASIASVSVTAVYHMQ